MTKTEESIGCAEVTDFLDIGDTSEGITFDGKGFLYVTSYTKGKILKIAPDETTSEFAKELIAPAAIAFDSNNNLYVCECGTFILVTLGRKQIPVWTKIPGKLTRISPHRTKKFILEADDGVGRFGIKKKRKIKHPNGIAVKRNGVVYVSEMSGFVARIEGDNARVLFSFFNWLPTPINFTHSPNGMALSKDERILYVNDMSSGDVWKISLDDNGNLVDKGKLPLSKSLRAADGIAIDDEGYLYITYELKHIAKVDPKNGKVEDVYSGDGLYTPANIAFGYGEGFDNKSIYITQLALGMNLAEAKGATIIKKMYIGTPGLVLPPCT